jgi:hypothetical protein
MWLRRLGMWDKNKGSKADSVISHSQHNIKHLAIHLLSNLSSRLLLNVAKTSQLTWYMPINNLAKWIP